MPAKGLVEITSTPDLSVVASAFFSAAAKGNALATPMQQIVDLFAEELAANFAAEGRPAHWQELALSTIKKRGSAHPILQDTGALEGSTQDWTISGSGQTMVATLSTPGYGGFHVTGTRFMAIRDWQFIPDSVLDLADDILSAWITAPIEAL